MLCQRHISCPYVWSKNEWTKNVVTVLNQVNAEPICRLLANATVLRSIVVLSGPVSWWLYSRILITSRGTRTHCWMLTRNHVMPLYHWPPAVSPCDLLYPGRLWVGESSSHPRISKQHTWRSKSDSWVKSWVCSMVTGGIHSLTKWSVVNDP